MIREFNLACYMKGIDEVTVISNTSYEFLNYVNAIGINVNLQNIYIRKYAHYKF